MTIFVLAFALAAFCLHLARYVSLHTSYVLPRHYAGLGQCWEVWQRGYLRDSLVARYQDEADAWRHHDMIMREVE